MIVDMTKCEEKKVKWLVILLFFLLNVIVVDVTYNLRRIFIAQINQSLIQNEIKKNWEWLFFEGENYLQIFNLFW